MKNKKFNPDNDCYDQSEEYFRVKDETDENEEYSPLDSSKPPHY